jgi:hypothetical protein
MVLVVGAAALLFAGMREDRDEHRLSDEPELNARVVSGPADDRFGSQLERLGVLRHESSRDHDRQVEQQVRDWRRYRPRSRYARLLGKAPSGSAFVLVPVREYDVMLDMSTAERAPQIARDGLCLMRRGTQGGAGVCGSTDDLLAGRLWGALAGQVYGVVPDGVTAVQPLPGAPLVAVHRNFYVYADPRERPVPPPRGAATRKPASQHTHNPHGNAASRPRERSFRFVE